MDNLEIQKLISEKVKLIKKSDSVVRTDKDEKLPDYYPHYRETVKMAEAIAVHADDDGFPEKLFHAKAPNMSEAEKKYMRMSFQRDTMPLWNKAVSNANRLFNEQNYNITWDNKVDETQTPEDYFTKEFPTFKSIIGYFESVVKNRTFADANAVIAIKPRELPYTVKQDNTGAEYEAIDDTILLEPIAVIYGSRQVVAYHDDYVLILLEEKSYVSFGNGTDKKKIGLIFELYDEENIYTITQVGAKIDYKFDIVPYFNGGHMLGCVPAWRLKGTPIAREEDIIYKSFFADAIPPLNNALYDSAILNCVKAAHAFPQRVEYAETCDEPNCNNGRIGGNYDENQVETFTTCKACNGSGVKNNHSPLGVYRHMVSNGKFDDGQSAIPFPGVAYVAPDNAILDFLRKEIVNNEKRAFEPMGLDVTNTEAQGSDTALGKIIDREAMFTFLTIVSNTIWDNLTHTIKTIGKMRYGIENFTMPQITRPKDFSIRSNADLTSEMALAQEKNLPEIYKNNLLGELMDTRFNANTDVNQDIKLLISVDALAALTALDIAAANASGVVEKWQQYLHINGGQYLQVLKRDAKWVDMDWEEKQAALIDMAKAAVPATNTSAAAIIGGVESPASSLSASVGGLTGMIEIVKAVSSGVYDLEAAIALVQSRFGLSYEEAKKQLGTPQQITTQAEADKIATIT